jgi:putative nucleotidyltransferase with HDIG domain
MTETVSCVTDAGAVAEPQRVLFVDDDQFLLDGLRDALRPYRRRWTMSFVTNGEDALAALDQAPHDVVVSDLRMPRLDGATLLEQVRQRYPSTVRIVLSGHADMKMVARAAAAAHRLIAKPCEIEELANVIERSCALQEITTRVELDRRAIGASALPSVPRLYAQLTELLASQTASASDVARIIEQDIAMAAKVLQLANSAYFGRRAETTKVANAVAYLGTETLRALLLHAEAFRAFQIDTPIPGFDLEAIHRHCGRVARLATEILKDTGANGGATLTAGLLHDVGLLVLASQDPHGLARTLALASEQNRPIHEIEREQHGITHAEVGAHLLALWGLPHTVTEAVAGHHDHHWLKLPFDEVAALHVATTLIEELESKHPPDTTPNSEADLDYLTRAGLADRRSHWQRLARDLLIQADS